MVLAARDELRHPANRDFHWRESLYFNFNDTANCIGGWLYLWVVPNQPQPSGMLISFYHGEWPDLAVTNKAMAAPRHLLCSGERWLYCFQKNSDALIAADFDNVEYCGLHLQRREPLKRYSLRFDDGEGSVLDLDCRFITLPYDYADGVFATPPWMAANRYHRAWRAEGRLVIARRGFDVCCTGDSDHSWGQRDMRKFGAAPFKMWSFQASDGRIAVSALKLGVDGGEVPLGFVAVDGVMAPVAVVESSALRNASGVQSDIALEIKDTLGRTVRGRLHNMHSFLGWGSYDSFWGYEGVGNYDVDGYGVLPGLSSYFWPAREHVKELPA